MDDPQKNNALRIHWHPAFSQAIQAGLLDYKPLLQFEYEYQLTSEPLRVDTLIILKPPSLHIHHTIGRIFKSVNLCEYKSPDDSLSIKDFFKVYAYASLYAAITPEADLADLTLTFVSTRHPRELIKYFRGVRNYQVEEAADGIYHVLGDYLPIQLIECQKLTGAENLLLKGLSKNLKREEADSILKEGKKRGKEVALGAYFDAILQANPKPFQEVVQMSNGTLTIEEVLTQAGLIPKWIDQGREEGVIKIAQNLLKKGWSVEDTAEVAELTIERVQALSASLAE
jgi:hypothetical protein